MAEDTHVFDTTEYNQQIQVAVADSSESATVEETTLSTGVVLRRKEVNIMRLQNIVNSFQYPEVPALWDKEREIHIKNPDHPVYRDAVNQVDQARILAAIDGLVATGTEAVFVPDDIPALESDEWIEECELFFKADIKRDIPKARYLSWVKYVAIMDQKDLEQLAAMVRQILGVSEENVAHAMRERFPNN